jgi:hypothetical protein
MGIALFKICKSLARAFPGANLVIKKAHTKKRILRFKAMVDFLCLSNNPF